MKKIQKPLDEFAWKKKSIKILFEIREGLILIAGIWGGVSGEVETIGRFNPNRCQIDFNFTAAHNFHTLLLANPISSSHSGLFFFLKSTAQFLFSYQYLTACDFPPVGLKTRCIIFSKAEGEIIVRWHSQLPPYNRPSMKGFRRGTSFFASSSLGLKEVPMMGIKHLYALFFLLVFALMGIGRPSLAAMDGVPGSPGGDFDPASDSEQNDCFSPRFGGIYLNRFWEVSEQLIGPPPCGFEVNSGEFYIPTSAWLVNSPTGSGDQCFPNGFALCYPEGYLPNGSPMEDFLSKVDSVTYVVDGRKSYTFPPRDIVKVHHPLDPTLPQDQQQATFLGKLPPLPLGEHDVEVIWHLTAMHCDGFGVDIGLSCIPAGDFPLPPARHFEVVPGASQSGN